MLFKKKNVLLVVDFVSARQTTMVSAVGGLQLIPLILQKTKKRKIQCNNIVLTGIPNNI